ncbi:precorrin-6y C5,15-methyltransferase (decarboxylating) subunit CbiE [Kytococcus sp. Marseille-QA3725]
MIEVVGVGEDGPAGWSPALAALVEAAPRVVGGARHLAMLEARPGQERLTWPSPLRAGLPELFPDAGRDGLTVVLASGDPLRSGVGTTLLEEFGPEVVRVHPALSSDTLARARMGWAAESCEVVTVVGRDPRRLLPVLAPGVRLVVLCSDGTGPAELARLLCETGWGSAQLTALWHLGGEREGRRAATAEAWGDEPTGDLVVLCVELPTSGPTAGAGPVPGRPDELFTDGGMITKRDLRAAALARLRPTPGAVLWDLGAGSGAVGIEWALAAPRARAVLVERDPHRAEAADQAAARLGVGDPVTVLRTTTAEAVADAELPTPDAVFCGGGVTTEVVDGALARLRPGGRVVAHGVTVETEQVLLAAQARHGGEVSRTAIERLAPLGGMHGWTPARTVTTWSLVKELDTHPDREGAP